MEKDGVQGGSVDTCTNKESVEDPLKQNIKIPGPSKVTKLSEDDPKPGPSNSAADFDLEVFDSGSSCSNEECWGVDRKIVKKLNPGVETITVSSVNIKMDEYPSDSETESTTALTRKHHRETQTSTDLINPVPSSSSQLDVPEVEEGEIELPKETLDRRENVEIWKSKNVTEAIVEDHDVYGTDENEDSMDSLVQNDDSMDSLGISSRRTSLCDNCEVVLVESTLSRCCSRSSNPESTVETPDAEDTHLPICDLYTQTCRSGSGRSYEVKTSQTESEYFQPHSSLSSLATILSSSSSSSSTLNPSSSSSSSLSLTCSSSKSLTSSTPSPLTCSSASSTPLISSSSTSILPSTTDQSTSTADSSYSISKPASVPTSNTTSMSISTSSDRVQPLKQTANFQTQTEAENFRPKRKSGSFSELSLSCVPSKKQRKPLELMSGDSTPKPFTFTTLRETDSGEVDVGGDTPDLGLSCPRVRDTMDLDSTPSGTSTDLDMTPLGSGTILHTSHTSSNTRRTSDCFMDSLNIEEAPYLSICDNTAPTSPASPEAAEVEDMEYEGPLNPPVHPLKPSPRALFSPGLGRNIIPDRENPPQEILDWVSTFSRWSNAERLVAINQLINTCEPSQVRHMMQVIEPQFQRDFISLLPKELALYVLSYLNPKDLLRAAQTCRYWRILAEDNLLWREKCREAGLQDCRENYRRRKYCSGFTYSPWKTGFMRQHNIEMNWRMNPIKSPKVLKGHDDHVITCLQFSGSRIVSGSDDNTLKVWSAGTGKCLRTLVGHTGGVWSSQMQGNIIVSGSTDRTLKVWNAETGSCVHTLYGHTSTVRCMHLHKNKVVSGSRDATLRMWDIETGECNIVLVGHVAAVRCVQYDGRLVVSGAYDYMVKVWNPEREECIHTLSGHTNRVYSLQFDGIHVVSGSLDTSIRVWDVETGSCKHALMGHQSLTSGMELKDNILVSGNADSTVKIWDIITGQCLQTLSGPNKHQSAVTCLHFNKNFVVTSSDDGTVKLWDVKSGEYIRDLVSLESGGSGGVVWRIRSSPTRLVCAVGSRNGTEETKLLVLDFDSEVK